MSVRILPYKNVFFIEKYIILRRYGIKQTDIGYKIWIWGYKSVELLSD